MDTIKAIIYISAICALLAHAPPAAADAVVNLEPPKVSLPDTLPPDTPAGREAEPAAPKPALNDACRLKGVLVCSEYGARQKEELYLILTDVNGYRYDALVYKDDGTFYTRIPCSGTYGMRLEFAGGSVDLGELTLPVADNNATYDLRIIHPGSMLELILEVRTSGESDLTVRDPIVVPSRSY